MIIEDSLGIAGELEAQIQHHVETYQCEWKTTIETPEKVQRFCHFINTDGADPSLAYVQERGAKATSYRGGKNGLKPERGYR